MRRGVVINPVFPALVGAAFGVGGAFLIVRYSWKANMARLQAAYLGEIEVILLSVRGEAKNAFSAWQEKRDLPGKKFTYARAIFDGNVAHLGKIGDKQLVRDIAFLYAVLEQAREEGCHLDGHSSDSEGLFRYAHHLWSALGMSMALIEKLSGVPPKVNRANQLTGIGGFVLLPAGATASAIFRDATYRRLAFRRCQRTSPFPSQLSQMINRGIGQFPCL